MTGGALLILAGLGYAAGYSVLFAKALNQLSLLNLELALDTAAKGQLAAARGYVREFSTLSSHQLNHWLVIGHLLASGTAAMASGSLLRSLAIQTRWEKLISYLFLLGGLLSASGYFLQVLGHDFYGRGLSALGYLWQFISMTGFIFIMILYAAAKPKR